MKRFAVENDSPDGGLTFYRECYGYNAVRGRVLSEHDTLDDALNAANLDNNDWIYDREEDSVIFLEEACV